MIQVPNQYVLGFAIGDLTDFIGTDQLGMLKVVEEAGNVLPTFELKFTTQDETLFGLLNEGNDLSVTLGKTAEDPLDMRLTAGAVTTIASVDRVAIHAKGMFSAVGYVSDTHVTCSEPMSGVEALTSVVAKYFDTNLDTNAPTFNILKSQDKQRWLQPNTSDRKYVSEMWLHSYLAESFIAVAISADGRFVLKDMKKQGEAYDWKFTQRANDPLKDITYDPLFVVDTRSAFINNWVGYGMEKLIYSLESGGSELVSEDAQPIIALTEEIAKRAAVEKRHQSVGMVTGNTHPNYWRAYLKNLTNLGMFGAVRLTVTVKNVFFAVKVLDLVMFKNDSSTPTSGSNEYLSGLYYVSKVVRTVQNNQLQTIVELCRESLNAMKVVVK